jgi:hypothetical protein
MGNAAIIWTFAGVLAAACFARGLATPTALWSLLCYALGSFILASASLIWISLEHEMMIQHRIVVAALGAIFGAFAFVSIGEWLGPSRAQVSAPQPQPPKIGDDNTFVGATPPSNMGSRNTFVVPNDSTTNTMMNRGGLAIGAGSCADSTSVAIGAGAGAGSCLPKAETKK